MSPLGAIAAHVWWVVQRCSVALGLTIRLGAPSLTSPILKQSPRRCSGGVIVDQRTGCSSARQSSRFVIERSPVQIRAPRPLSSRLPYGSLFIAAHMGHRINRGHSLIEGLAPQGPLWHLERCLQASCRAYSCQKYLPRFLVLLRHNFRYLPCAEIGPAQQGHRDSVATRATINLRRIVAMEFVTWRSGRNGGPSGPISFGNCNFREQPGGTSS